MVAYISICTIVSALYLCAGISVFLKAPRERINQTFCLSTIALVLWILFDGTSILYWDQIEVRTILTRDASAAGILATGAIACFCIVFANSKDAPRKTLVLVSFVTVLLTILALLPGVVFKEFRVEGSHIVPINGPLRAPLYVMEAFLFLLGLGHLLRRYRNTLLDEERLRLKILAAGILIPAFITIAASSILPGFLSDSPALASVGPLSTIIFIVLAGYAIFRHGLFTVDLALEYMFNNINVGLCVTQTDGRIIRHNRRLVEILKCDDLTGQPLQDLIGLVESRKDKNTPPLHSWFKTGQPESMCLHLPGLEDKSVEMTAHHLTDNGGSRLGCVYLFTDVTARKRAEEALRQNEEHFRALIENALDAIGVVGIDGAVLYESPSVERILGYKPEEMVGLNAFENIHPKHKKRVMTRFNEVMQNGREVTFGEFPYQHKDGSWRIVEVSAKKLAGEDSVVVNYRDITDRKKAEEALKESERRYRMLAEAVTDMIWILDAKSLRFTYVSSSVQGMLGYTVEEAIAKPLDQVLAPASFDLAMDVLAEALASPREKQDDLVKSRPLELEHFRKDGSTVWAEVTTTFLRDHDGRLVEILGATRDITRRRQRIEKLRAMSLVDELTGLYNRRGFLTLCQQQLKLACRARKSMAVLFIDFDNLKQINDTLGHEQGNSALKETANVLRDTFRESDIIARIGGDEFAIMAVEVPRDSVEILSKRLQEKIETRNTRRDAPHKLSISMGVARFDPNFPCSVEELLSEADKLMYEEKRHRKDSQPDSLPVQ